MRRKRYGDTVLPGNWVPQPHDDRRDYESAIVEGLRAHVQSGDHVVIVGGGFGVSAVVAAELVGSTGHVTVYEGDRRSLRRCRRTILMNGYGGRVTLNQEIIGKAVSLDGNAMSAEHLPDCDVLELDCEGAELDIIDNITFAPRSFIVESHGFLGAPSSSVMKKISSKGYKVRKHGVAEISMKELCIKKDIVVISGKRAK